MQSDDSWLDSDSLDGIGSPQFINDDDFEILIDEDCADQNEDFPGFTSYTEETYLTTSAGHPTSSRSEQRLKRQRPGTPRLSLLLSPVLSDADLEEGLLIKASRYTEFPYYNDFSSLPVFRPLGSLEHSQAHPCPARPSAMACALVAQMQSLIVAGALMHLTASSMHPIGDGEYATLEWTMSALLALCKRAELQEEEITPQMLLTLMWMCESWACAGITLTYALNRYTTYEPSHRNPAFRRGLRGDMISNQIYVLKCCNWRMSLQLDTDLEPARADLEAHPTFQVFCAQIRDEAMHWASMTTPAHRLNVNPSPPKMIIPLFQMTPKKARALSLRAANLLLRPDE